MGYRSDLVVAVPKTVRTQCMLDNTWPALLAESDPVKEHSDIQFWEVNGIKWYVGNYPEVDELDNFLAQHGFNDGHDDNKLFVAAVRLGEEFGDVETWGEPSEYDIFANQSIDY